MKFLFLILLIIIFLLFIKVQLATSDTTYQNSFIISGIIGDYLNKPFANVKIQSSDGTILSTNNKGFYEINISTNKTVLITPTLDGFIFEPTYRVISESTTFADFIIFKQPVTRTVLPNIDTVLVYTDTQELTTIITFTKNTLSNFSVLKFTPLIPQKNIIGRGFDLPFYTQQSWGRGFELSTENNSGYIPTSRITMHYNTDDLSSVLSAVPQLFHQSKDNLWYKSTASCLFINKDKSTQTNDTFQGYLCEEGVFGLYSRIHLTNLPYLMK